MLLFVYNPRLYQISMSRLGQISVFAIKKRQEKVKIECTILFYLCLMANTFIRVVNNKYHPYFVNNETENNAVGLH